MGTASLVFGLVLIGFAIFFLVYFGATLMSVEMIQGGNAEDDGTYGPLIIVVGLFAVGGLLVRGFFKDRKKENNS